MLDPEQMTIKLLSGILLEDKEKIEMHVDAVQKFKHRNMLSDAAAYATLGGFAFQLCSVAWSLRRKNRTQEQILAKLTEICELQPKFGIQAELVVKVMDE